MRQIEIQTLKAIEIDELASPLRVKPWCGHTAWESAEQICCYLGKFPFFDFPRIPGHELGVEVLEVGEGVENVSPGDRCSVEPYMNCDDCYSCRYAYNCCQNLKVIGVMMTAVYASLSWYALTTHPSKQLNYDQLALVETLAIGCHAMTVGSRIR